MTFYSEVAISTNERTCWPCELDLWPVNCTSFSKWYLVCALHLPSLKIVWQTVFCT